MKRLTSVLLILSMLFSFTACTSQDVTQNTPSVSTETAVNENSVEMDSADKQADDPISTENTEKDIELPENSNFEVHYIDVGQADAALVLCDDETMLIDGGNVADSSLIVSYLNKRNISHLDYVIGTHAHEDHIGGLSGALSVATAGKVYAPKTEADSKAYQNFKSKVQAQGLQITNPTPNETFTLGSSSVRILAPITESVSDINNTSIILKITYGSTSFLFTGDAEREEEQDIINKGYDLSATVLKVGHHGSENSTSYVFLREVMPEYAIISVGKNNSYGHPTEEALSRLRDSDTKVYRTDLQGDIIAKSDGKTVTITPSRNADIETNTTIKEKEQTYIPPAVSVPAQQEQSYESTTAYIGNANTKKFHYPDCHSVDRMKDSNKVRLNCTRSQAISKGYSPCGNCNP